MVVEVKIPILIVVYTFIPTTSTGGTWANGASSISLTPSDIADIVMNKINEILPGACAAERYYYIAHPIQGFEQIDMISTTKAYSNILFCSPGLDDDNKNAFIHMFWNSMMRQKWGYINARNASDVHEECGGTSTQIYMGKYNNDIGAKFGYFHSNYSTFAFRLNALTNIIWFPFLKRSYFESFSMSYENATK